MEGFRRSQTARTRWRSLSARPEKGYRSMHTYGRRCGVLAAAALALAVGAGPAGAAGRDHGPGQRSEVGPAQP